MTASSFKYLKRNSLASEPNCVVEGCDRPYSKNAGGHMCTLHYSRKWQETRPQGEKSEKYRAWREARGSRWAQMGEEERAKYRAANARRRAIRRGATAALVTDRDLRRLVARHGDACAYCRAPLSLVTWDHVVPLAAGGLHTVGNLVPACETCNKSKGSAFFMEWRLAKLDSTRRIPKRTYSNAD